MVSIEQNLSQSTQFTDFHLRLAREVLDAAQEKLGLGTGASTLRFLVGLAARVPAVILRRLAQGDIQPGDFYDAAERSADTLPKREEAPPPLGADQPHDADDDSGESEEEESEEQLPEEDDQGDQGDPYEFIASPLFDGGALAPHIEYQRLKKASKTLEKRQEKRPSVWAALVARAHAILLFLLPQSERRQLPSFLASLEASTTAELEPLFTRIRRWLRLKVNTS